MTEDNREPHPDVPGEPAPQPPAPPSADASAGSPEQTGPAGSIEAGLTPENGEPTPPHGIPAQPVPGGYPQPAPDQSGAQPTFAQLSGQPSQGGPESGAAYQPPPYQRSEWAGEQVVFGSAAPGLGTPPRQQHQQHQQQPPMPMRLGQNNPSPRVPEQRRGGSALVTGVSVLALLVGGGAGALGGYLVADSQANAPVSNSLDDPPPAEQASNAPAGSVEAVAEKVLPSVVQLQVRGGSSAGEGSGFIISSDGLILTNNHVVESAASGGQITAVFQDGSTAGAQIVGRDPTSDLAVVRAEGKSGLPDVEFGSSGDLRVGEGVVAIGSPFELAGTVTSGIVSSLQRPTRAGGEGGSQATVLDAIQTDAAINPGNSGGPLINMEGQIIGINSVIYSPTGGGQGQAGSVGLGFAIPIDQARRTAKEIVDTGKATQTVLGVSVQDGQNGGAEIMEVTPGGAAEQAGLKVGDVVTKLDDRRIDTSDALVAAVRSHAPGDKVALELDNGSRTVEATLAGQPVETE
jgi:putative serine protease PepD